MRSNGLAEGRLVHCSPHDPRDGTVLTNACGRAERVPKPARYCAPE